MKWNGSVAIITGASRGIGASVARAAAARGARVGLIARSKDELDEVLTSIGGDGAVAACDVGVRADVEEAIASLERALGPTDILVNNAGIGAWGLIQDTDVEMIEKMMRVNYFGTVYATKAVLPGMLARGKGHIANVASVAGRIGAPFEGPYSATKFAVVGLSEALSIEVAKRGIDVSMINPGPVATDFFDARGVPYKRPFPKALSPELVAARVIEAVEKRQTERIIPGWLRFPAAVKLLVPALYRRALLFDYRKELR